MNALLGSPGLRARCAGLLIASACLHGGAAEAQTLSSTCGSPFTFAAPPAGNAPQTLLLSPDGTLLFAGSPDTSITVLGVGAGGALSLRGSFANAPAVFTSGLAIDPGGTRLYATTFLDVVNVHAVGPGGALTEIQSAPLGVFGSALNGIEYVALPGGDWVYVNNDIFGDNFVSALPVLSGGVLGAPQIVPTNGSGSGGGFFGSPRLRNSATHGGRLFVLNAQSNDVSVFTIGADGSLTAVSSLPFPIGGFSSGAIAVDPAGAFLYAGTQSQGIAKLAIDPTTGALEAVPGSPFAGATGGRQVDGLEVHPSGAYLLASLPDAEQLTVVGTTSMSPAPFSPRFGDGVPTGVLFDATGSRAFAADIFSGTTVSVYDFGVFAPLTLSNLTVKANGTFNPKTGFATITGSFNRSTTTAASVQVSLFQKVGRTTIVNGSSFAVLPCGSGASPWTVQITGAAFGGGAAFATVSVSAIDPVTGQFLQTQVENVPVKLKGS